jgi:chaperonin GroEL (HSP60 family)
VTKSGATLGEIVSSVKRVTDIVGDIVAASEEQSSGIDQVNRAVTQMDRVVQTNAAQSEELSSTANSLTAQAEQLQALVARFKLANEHRAPDAPAFDAALEIVDEPKPSSMAGNLPGGAPAKAEPKPVYYIGSAMRH